MNDDLEPNNEARALTADLLTRLTLDVTGDPITFPENDLDWAAADAAQPEIVRLGAVRFKVVGDGEELALALGALEVDELPAICMHVAFEDAEDVPVPVVGQFIVLGTERAGVSVVFEVCATYDFLQPGPDEPDLGPNAVQIEACGALQPGEAVLVQVFDPNEQEVDHAAR